MTVFDASLADHRDPLAAAVSPAGSWLVACLCAAWCKTCDEYRSTFDALAAARPDWAFAWVDIEDEAELVGDHDIEDFPTLLVQRGDDVLFLGALTPQPGVALRLLESLSEAGVAPIDSELDLRALLAARPRLALIGRGARCIGDSCGHDVRRLRPPAVPASIARA